MMNTQHYILTIKAEDRPGLLHLITGVIEKRQFSMRSLNAVPTDIHDIVLITIEIEASEQTLTSLALKLENIIEVFSVEATLQQDAICLRAAFFKLSTDFWSTESNALFQRHHATVASWSPSYFLVSKYGTAESINRLYRELDGPHLLGFSQTGLIADSKLMEGENDDRVAGSVKTFKNIDERINRLAA